MIKIRRSCLFLLIVITAIAVIFITLHCPIRIKIFVDKNIVYYLSDCDLVRRGNQR